MHASRFDRVTRLLAQRTSRRQISRVAGSLAAGGTLGSFQAARPAIAVRQSAAVCLDDADHGSRGPQDGLAFTFSPEVTGKLSQVDIVISHPIEGPAGDYLVRLLPTDDTGTPTFNRILAKKTVPYGALTNTGFVTLTAKFKKRKTAKIVAGTMYAILVSRNKDASTTLVGRPSNPCPDARLFSLIAASRTFVENSGSDAVFEVFAGYE